MPFSELARQQLPEDLLDVWHDGQNFLVLGKSGRVYVLRTLANPLSAYSTRHFELTR